MKKVIMLSWYSASTKKYIYILAYFALPPLRQTYLLPQLLGNP